MKDNIARGLALLALAATLVVAILAFRPCDQPGTDVDTPEPSTAR